MPKISKKNIGIIFGGRSGEHEVSIVSAKSVMDNLDKKKYNVIPIGITKKGEWISGSIAIEYLQNKAKNLPFKTSLLPDPQQNELLTLESRKGELQSIKKQKLDVVFPVVHGTYGEDGKLQGLLEMANIAYVGPEVLGSALGMDKVVQKQLFEAGNLPTVKFVWFLKKHWQDNSKECINKVEKKLRYPVFVKPANMGSSVGITKCKNKTELVSGIEIATCFDRKIIVEQGVVSPKEIEVAVLGNENPKASVCGEIISSNEFYDYDAKYVDNKSEAVIPAKLPKKVLEKIRKTAIDAFKILDLCGMSRVDFLVSKDNKIFLNEVNTIPGFTSISMYPKLWQASGLSYTSLLDELISLAIERFNQKNMLQTTYKPKEDWYT